MWVWGTIFLFIRYLWISISKTKIIFVSPAKQKRDIGIAFSALSSSAAARRWRRKLLSSFQVQLRFSGSIRARVMKLGTSIHLVEGS